MGWGGAATALLCSEGHVWGERAGTGNTPLWRDGDEGWREIHYPPFALAPEMKEQRGLLGISKMIPSPVLPALLELATSV